MLIERVLLQLIINLVALHRKNKVGIILTHPKIRAEIYIICYGKDADELKTTIQYHVDFFTKIDKLWKLINVVDLKKSTETKDIS